MIPDNGWENSRDKWYEWKVNHDPLEAEVFELKRFPININLRHLVITEQLSMEYFFVLNAKDPGVRKLCFRCMNPKLLFQFPQSRR